MLRKDKIQKFIANSIAGQEPCGWNSLSRFFAGKEYQPIPTREVIRNVKYDRFYDWNNTIRTLGVAINRLAETFWIIKPKLSPELITKTFQLIQGKTELFYRLKREKSTIDSEKLMKLRTEIFAANEEIYALEAEIQYFPKIIEQEANR